MGWLVCISWLFQTGPDYFSVRWRGPTDVSEFDRYQVFWLSCHDVWITLIMLIFSRIH